MLSEGGEWFFKQARWSCSTEEIWKRDITEVPEEYYNHLELIV